MRVVPRRGQSMKIDKTLFKNMLTMKASGKNQVFRDINLESPSSCSLETDSEKSSDPFADY